MEKIDLVYVLGTGSQHNDRELRMSLRSVQSNLYGVGTIHVVGECPDWLCDVNFIPCPDIFGTGNAAGNIINKVAQACKSAAVSDTFLFMNDDYIICNGCDARKISNLHKGEMRHFPSSYFTINEWRMTLARTRDALCAQGLTAYHYDCHAPLLMRKDWWMATMQRFDWESGAGLCMKSLYGNVNVPERAAKFLTTEKVVVFQHHDYTELERKLADATFLSYNDAGINDALWAYLERKFPNPSKYER